MKIKREVWVEKYGNLYLVENPNKPKATLQNGIYELEYNEVLGFSLNPISEKFEFDYKIYGLETSLINRIIKYYKSTNYGNLGILLNGVKGTGKTVTSKIIANSLEKPVILINEAYPNAEDFINSIPQDIVVFVDEYEKIYEKSHEFLTIMDGVLNSEYRRVFLLTTNNLYIDSNLIDRPSRVRYLQTFNSLTPDIVEEIVDDILIYPEFREDIIKYISTLEIITVDIVKTILTEVNIHNESPNIFKDVFNVTVKTGKYKVFIVNEEGDVKSLAKGAKISCRLPFGERSIGNYFYVNDETIGEIIEVIDYSTIKVKLEDIDNSELEEDEEPSKNPFNLPDNGVITLSIVEDYVYNDTYMYGKGGKNMMREKSTYFEEF
jgi:DNA-directed RNA polymerase subunit F